MSLKPRGLREMWFPFGSDRPRGEVPFPPEWLAGLEENVLLYRRLPEADQARLRARVPYFIAARHWEGCRGLTVTDEMKVTVAAQACLLTLGWDEFDFHEPRTVLLYPGSYLAPVRYQEPEEQNRLGEAHYRGPVVLSWWHARWDSRRLGRHNLVLHEFAHKVAERGDRNTGMPPIENPQLRARWEEVVAPEYERLAEAAEYGRPTLLDPYGAANRAEFFAVATECFFLQSACLRTRHPELYGLLAEFYGQGPAQWKGLGPVKQEQVQSADQEYWQHALAECEAAVRLRPEWAHGYRLRADCCWQLGDYDRAIADYGQVIRLTEGDERAQAHRDRGWTYRDAGRYKEALRDFDRALEILPAFTEAYYQRGITFREQGDLDRALADLTRAIRLDPRDDAARFERGKIHALRKQYPQALHDFGRAIRLHPHGEGAFLHRAEVYLAMGEYEKAVADCDEAIRLAPDYADTYRVRAQAHAALGNPELASRDRVRAEECEAGNGGSDR